MKKNTNDRKASSRVVSAVQCKHGLRVVDDHGVQWTVYMTYGRNYQKFDAEYAAKTIEVYNALVANGGPMNEETLAKLIPDAARVKGAVYNDHDVEPLFSVEGGCWKALQTYHLTFSYSSGSFVLSRRTCPPLARLISDGKEHIAPKTASGQADSMDRTRTAKVVERNGSLFIYGVKTKYTKKQRGKTWAKENRGFGQRQRPVFDLDDKTSSQYLAEVFEDVEEKASLEFLFEEMNQALDDLEDEFDDYDLYDPILFECIEDVLDVQKRRLGY